MRREGVSFLILITIALLFCSSKVEFGGIGIEVPTGNGVVKQENPYIISSVYESTPAEKAGLKTGDIIEKINDTPLAGLTYNHIVKNLLRGKAGSPVKLEIKRKDETLNFILIRAKIVLK